MSLYPSILPENIKNIKSILKMKTSSSFTENNILMTQIIVFLKV